MFRLLIFLLLFVQPFVISAQGINFLDKIWDQALQEASLKNKLIFLDLYATWCGPCKVMDKNVFTNPEVAQNFNQHFINIKLDAEKGEGKDLAARYGVMEYPSYFFIDPSGEVVHRLKGYQPVLRLLHESDQALKLQKDFIPLRTLEIAYQNGKREADFLEDLLSRKALTQGPQPELLDQYLISLPKGELKTEKTLGLIAQNIGSVQSVAFKELIKALNNFLKLTETQQKLLLNGIGQAKLSTFKHAVDAKDEALFKDLLEAVHSSSYSQEAAIQEERQFRYDFARLTGNFKHFAVIAHNEAARILSQNQADFTDLDQAKKEIVLSEAERMGIPKNAPQVQQQLKLWDGGSQRAAAVQLNEFAYGFWKMTNNKTELQNALKWSATAIKLFESPANWQTYALLLKKLGRIKDAKKAIKQAVKLAKSMGGDTKTLQKTLDQG